MHFFSFSAANPNPALNAFHTAGNPLLGQNYLDLVEGGFCGAPYSKPKKLILSRKLQGQPDEQTHGLVYAIYVYILQNKNKDVISDDLGLRQPRFRIFFFCQKGVHLNLIPLTQHASWTDKIGCGDLWPGGRPVTCVC